MIRIINQKRYNTETATLVARTEFSNQGDFRYLSEDLYRTQKGAWFLHGVGGPMTRYAVDLGNNSTAGGEEITPMTDNDAFSWLEAADDPKALESFFADRIEDA
jgi:hypothetical protein